MYINHINERYSISLNRLNSIKKEIDNNDENNEYKKFIKYVINTILSIKNEENEENFELELKTNNDFYKNLQLLNYEKCYGNPEYSLKIFEDENANIISYIHRELVIYLENIKKNKLINLSRYNELIINLYEEINNKENIKMNIRKCINKYINNDLYEVEKENLLEEMNPEYSFYKDICKSYDGDKFTHLIKYGKYISQDTINFSRALESLPKEKIDKLSDVIVEAYLHSFISQNKNRNSRKSIRITYVMGQEKVMKGVINKFENFGFKPHIYNLASDSINKQFEYDHRFDDGLYLDENYVDNKIDTYEKLCEQYKEILLDQSGLCGIMQFGEIPFSPISTNKSIVHSKEQLNLIRKMNIKMSQIQEKYIPRGEISFSKSGLPSYQIGENFEEILNDIIDINMLDSRRYEQIQQIIIDELDKGEYIHVKGRHKNKTDIVVRMNKIKDPKTQTNYLNGGGDVNIPVGEVFTTPILDGTNGIFHVEKVYLKGFKFLNLKLKIEDGYIVDYSCTNFDNKIENKEYIEENLLYPHKTLPIGEFAIGSNTLAYTISKKHNILDRLPILFIEKMGPHFAIGDPCYVWSEDNYIRNLLDNKEIIAKENEKTALRKEDIDKAYTSIHTDITIPYDDIEFIKAINSNEEIYIMNDGKFSIEGTEELNMHLL